MNKPVRKLQIKLLSKSGELLNCINCYSGQLSVFRASSNSELQPYLRAISGTTGSERFVVELDGESFLPNEHTLIGFGERFIGDEGSVTDYLISHGVPQFGIDSLLLTYGLERVIPTKCHLLSRCEERRLRLLAATFSNTGVLVAYEPFDPISSEWREKFAELLVNYARNNKQIVIIPSLSYRPQCWIDNDHVARIQVGESIQKTVGFGNSDTDVQALVKQMRQILKDPNSAEEIIRNSGAFSTPIKTQHHFESKEEPVKQISDLEETSSTLKSYHHIRHDSLQERSHDEPELNDSNEDYHHSKKEILLDIIYRVTERYNITPKLIGVVTVTLLIVLVVGFWPRESTNNPTNQQVAVVSERTDNISVNGTELPVQESAVNQVSTDQSAPSPESITNTAQNGDQPPQTDNNQAAVQPQSIVLASYSAPIHDAVVQAFEGSGVVISGSGSSSSTQSAKPQQPSKQASEASDFLRLLQYAESSTENNNPTQDSYSYSNEPPPMPHDGSPFAEENMDEQQRREAIRQKFLEAIQRAQERRGESGE